MVISGRGVGACTAPGAEVRGNGDSVGEETVVFARVGTTVGWLSGAVDTGGFSGQSGGGFAERLQMPSRIQSA